MSRVCDLTGKKVLFGNNVSHSHRRTRRKFSVNLQKIKYESILLKKLFSFRLATRTIRSIDKNGGLDAYLLSTKANNLSPPGQLIRRKVKKALIATGWKFDEEDRKKIFEKGIRRKKLAEKKSVAS